jgi:hypothetical protein
MYRLVVLVLLFSQWMIVQPFPAVAQATSDAEAAAIVAVELSALEASSDFNSLYDRIHPDAHAEMAALCAMVATGHRDPEVIVAIHRDGGGAFELFPPCGRCRELISDFDLDTWVIVGTLEQPFKVRIAELLPFKAG